MKTLTKKNQKQKNFSLISDTDFKGPRSQWHKSKNDYVLKLVSILITLVLSMVFLLALMVVKVTKSRKIKVMRNLS